MPDPHSMLAHDRPTQVYVISRHDPFGSEPVEVCEDRQYAEDQVIHYGSMLSDDEFDSESWYTSIPTPFTFNKG